MRRSLAFIFAGVLLGAGALYQFGGVRVTLDGSGVWPRLLSSDPDYDALEADRARQKGEAAASATDATPAAPAPVGGSAAAPPAAVAAARPAAGSAPWPDFRGPRRDGRYDGPPIRTDWPSSGLPVAWKQPVGMGYASFVVAEGRAFTIEQRRRQEVVAAYDVATGRELWINRWDAEFTESLGGDGPRATPTYHAGRIYALGAEGEFRSLDAGTGAVLWRRNILDDAGAQNLTWGMSAAPLIVDDMVIVLPGGRGGRSVAAYAVATGEPVWSSLDDQQAYSSPMLVTLAGQRQIILMTATRVVGVTVDAGRLLWEFAWPTEMGINSGQPLLLGGDRVFVSSGYGKGAAVFQVARDGERFSTQTIWQNIRMKNKFTSSVLHNGYVYGLDEAILACVDAATGDLEWKGGRYGYGQIMLAGDHLVVLTEDGQVVLVKATPTAHEELSRFEAIEGRTWNHPVIAEGRLLVRNLREMAAFEIVRR